MKYLGICLIKMQDLYVGNYKMLMKEIKANINKWRYIPYS